MRTDRRATVSRLLRSAALAGLLAVLPTVGCGEHLTVLKYERIEQGMTLEDVEQLLGRGVPHAGTPVSLVSAEPSAGGAVRGRQAFLWRSGERQVIVMFRAGKVVSKHRDGF